MDSKPKKNIRDYFLSNPRFLIPAYQRGYKWGVCGIDGSSAAKNLIIDIINAFEKDNRDEYFIQGVTGYEKDGIFHLIDGQQRTTTLFILIALLADDKLRTRLLFDDKGKELRLIYFGKRNTSASYLEELCRDGIIRTPTEKQDTQDVHFLHKAAKEMKSLLPTDPNEKLKLLENLLDKVFIFQIEVDGKEAPNVFSMMNGNKADMKIEELIKAQYLSGLTKIEGTKSVWETADVRSTLRILEAQIADATAREWKINASRSRLAREWDKWVYWWMRPDVRSFFHTSSDDMTGWLIQFFCKQNGVKYDSNPKVEIRNQSFNAFSKQFLSSSELNNSYESIRRLQKRMEDLYEDTTTYNLLGFLLDILGASERADVISYFLKKRDSKDYLNYALFRMADLTHNQAKERIEGTVDEDAGNKIEAFIKVFENEDIYNDNKEWGYRYLFLCNVMASEERNAKFEFWYNDENKLVHYWSRKSIEHIWPKSKVSDNGGDGIVSKHLLNESNVSEHMLGNLVFLHILDNTRFQDKTPTEKRQRYFDLRSQDEDGKRFYSRGLLHTMSAFGGEEWEKDLDIVPQIIRKRHNKEINILKKRYGITK